MCVCHVQMICDGARLYADKVHSILERNCYYDPDLGQFDVTERVSSGALWFYLLVCAVFNSTV